MGIHSRTALALLAAGLTLGAATSSAQEALDIGIWNQGPFGGDPPGGLCFDLMETIAERTGLVFNYNPMPANQLIPAVVSGALDLECSALAAPGRRDPGIVFVGPILTNNETMLVRTDDGTAYVSLADFAGKRIGTTVNPGRQAAITAAGYEPVLFDAPALAAEALAAGNIDAWMVNAAEAPRLSTETPGLRIVDTYVGVIVNYGMIGVAHGEVELMGTILQALEGLKIDGTLDAIADRWSVPRAPF
ncbi:MAG: transporter substrate-binding domain-containing protein [Bauldia sp.]|nr:transporter substrate-binding domain-containing protein [Bauldia sp.]